MAEKTQRELELLDKLDSERKYIADLENRISGTRAMLAERQADAEADYAMIESLQERVESLEAQLKNDQNS